MNCWPVLDSTDQHLPFAWTLLNTMFVVMASVKSDRALHDRNTRNEATNYAQHNLHDYCADKTWSDYPGLHIISTEKSLLISSPLVFQFQYNSSRKFVSYCLVRLVTRDGNRIFATGSASGMSTNGKLWFTESLHFTPTKPKTLLLLLVSEVFEKTTHSNALELVFEQLDRQPFNFHLVVTPFRDKGNESACESVSEYACNNGRCVESYLECDHRNNCGDFSDESENCVKNLPTTTTTFTSEITRSVSSSTASPSTISATQNTTHTHARADNGSLVLDARLAVFNIFIYIAIVLSVIVVVTTVNFTVWCLVTKRDQSFFVLRRTNTPNRA